MENAEGALVAGREPEMTQHELLRELEKRSEDHHVDVHADDREEKLARDEEHQHKERVEKKHDALFSFGQKAPPKKQLPKPAPPPKKASDGFETPQTKPIPVSVGTERAEGVTAVQSLAQALHSTTPRLGKPPDAMSLLHAAQDAGVYFREDAHQEGHAEDKEDPELAAAVEETIRLLFGVRGIHRVGPGKNDAGEPVVVVVASRGFGEASLRSIPPMVHRFPTLLALPYDLLPLRRER